MIDGTSSSVLSCTDSFVVENWKYNRDFWFENEFFPVCTFP